MNTSCGCAAAKSWSETLLRETRELMAAVLPVEAHEREFLECLNGAGNIAPELLTAEPAMQGIIRDHTGLRWKALNGRSASVSPLATGDCPSSPRPRFAAACFQH